MKLTTSTWHGRTRWFAAEFLVVVTGVLVALALQSLYERGAESRRERAYLHQLAAELRTTEATMATADQIYDYDEMGINFLIGGDVAVGNISYAQRGGQRDGRGQHHRRAA